VALLATSGMRRGEALGLRWADLVLVEGRASIRQTLIVVSHFVQMGTPKTAKGRRTVSLDGVTIAALKELRTRQDIERLEMSAGWTDLGPGVRPGRQHAAAPGAVHPPVLREVRWLGLPNIRLHDLRPDPGTRRPCDLRVLGVREGLEGRSLDALTWASSQTRPGAQDACCTVVHGVPDGAPVCAETGGCRPG